MLRTLRSSSAKGSVTSLPSNLFWGFQAFSAFCNVMSRSLIFKSMTAGAGLPSRRPAGPAGRSRPLLEGVGLTNPGVQSLLALTMGIRLLPALARSRMMSMAGKLSGLRRDKGSLANLTKKSRSYCFLPSVLIGDHCSGRKNVRKWMEANFFSSALEV